VGGAARVNSELQRRENNSSPRATTSSDLDSGAPYVITQTQGWGYASDGTMDLLLQTPTL